MGYFTQQSSGGGSGLKRMPSYITELYPDMYLDTTTCTSCGLCYNHATNSCPLGESAIYESYNGMPAIDFCVVCGNCILMCPVGSSFDKNIMALFDRNVLEINGYYI